MQCFAKYCSINTFLPYHMIKRSSIKGDVRLVVLVGQDQETYLKDISFCLCFSSFIYFNNLF